MTKKLAKRLVIHGVECRLVKGFASAALNLAESLPVEKRAVVIKGESGQIVDYQNLSGEGYVTTWAEDETGETSNAEAFTKALIAEYLKVPALMMDHGWGVLSQAGSVTSAEPDMRGCKVKFDISNAPGLVDLRFKVAEGHCKTLSISGYASMDEATGKYTILKWIETSIVSMPANRECMFSITDGQMVNEPKEPKKAMPGMPGKVNQDGANGGAAEKLPATPAAPTPAPSQKRSDRYEIAQGLKLKR